MSGECSTCGAIGGGGFFREPTNLGDQPNGMQLIPCPQCGGVREARFRARATRWGEIGLRCWVVLLIAAVALRSTHVVSNSWWIILFPLWGAIVLWTVGPIALSIVKNVLLKVLRLVLWLIT